MRAMEKDRTRRYETANGLAMDIQRHMNCEPVVACPPSRLYEFKKTVRRHKFGFAAVGQTTNDYWNFYTRDDPRGGWRMSGVMRPSR